MTSSCGLNLGDLDAFPLETLELFEVSFRNVPESDVTTQGRQVRDQDTTTILVTIGRTEESRKRRQAALGGQIAARTIDAMESHNHCARYLTLLYISDFVWCAR